MSNSDRARLGRNLKTAREAAGVTQTQAAAAVQRTRQTIVNWENEEHSAEPSTPQLAVLGELYGVTPKDLRFAEIERANPGLLRSTYVKDRDGRREHARLIEYQ